LLIDYAGMDAAKIALWLLIATGSGLLGRIIVRGKKILGLWGDAAIGLIGVFLVGTVMRAFHFDLTAWLVGVLPGNVADLAVWFDIAISALIGAILIRAVIRPFTGGG
jgi:uncharacterized membrane protein YeaQ/YmgE (transglycosylase-associated protein family)